MKEVVIAAAVRTPVGNFNGSLAPMPAADLGALVIAAALRQAGLSGNVVDEVIMGNILQAGQGQNPARQAAVKAGLPVEVPSFTINKLCGSGLKAVNLAAQSILAGDAEIVVAGGMESMSNAPYLLESKARWGYRMGHAKMIDSMIQDGLWCAFHDYHMGVTAENVAERYGITREEQDLAALESQKKAVAAIAAGAFTKEIVPVILKGKKGDVTFAVDEYPKPETTLESLAKLKPAFKKDGSVTAGNASGINDGAAALVVMSGAKAREMGISPLATLRSYAAAAVEPAVMGLGPVPAVKKALAKAGLTVGDMDLIEANEAFAAQFLAVARELEFPPEKVNINGGAIALGHPIGASGARILVTLLHALERNHLRTGLATLCIGGGQGVATIVER